MHTYIQYINNITKYKYKICMEDIKLWRGRLICKHQYTRFPFKTTKDHLGREYGLFTKGCNTCGKYEITCDPIECK